MTSTSRGETLPFEGSGYWQQYRNICSGEKDERLPCSLHVIPCLQHLTYLQRQAHLPTAELEAVRGYLYGFNAGSVVKETTPEGKQPDNFEFRQFAFKAAPMQFSGRRMTRIGVVQNSIALPTTEPYAAQREVGAKSQMPTNHQPP